MYMDKSKKGALSKDAGWPENTEQEKAVPRNNVHFCQGVEKGCTNKQCMFLPLSRKRLYQEIMYMYVFLPQRRKWLY